MRYACPGCGKTYVAIIGAFGRIPKPGELCYVCNEPERRDYAAAVECFLKRVP